ncbi:MAG: ABC transporter permease [Bacteroidota bacterium]
MLRIIIEKEILDNLMNIRFIAASIISTVLIIAAVMIHTNGYKNELADYNGRQIAQEDFIQHYGHLNRFGWMAQPVRGPSRFAFFVRGIDREAEQLNFVSNPLPALFSEIDLVGIVTIIMSLMAILFSYNAISGEREAGLLKLMLSTHISRSTIVLGKFIGGSITILIPFTVGVLAGLVYVIVNPSIQIQGVDAGVFALLLLASFLYISAFYGLGLYFSARSHSSNTAVLKSLFAWVIFVLMLPNISPFLAAQLYHIPSKTTIDQATWTLQGEERDKIINQRTKELQQMRYADIAKNITGAFDGSNENSVKVKAETDPAFKLRYNQYRKDWMAMVDEVNAKQKEKADAIRKEFIVKSKFQEKLAGMLASVSPLPNFVFIATDLTDTGIQDDADWKTQSEQYFTDMNPKLMAIYNKAVEKNPALTVNDFLDLREFPRFQRQPIKLSDKIDSTLPHFGVLAFFNLLFLAGAFVSFLRYDAR